jgi:hypothetical protein
MRRRHHRIVLLALLVAGSVLTTASPAWAANGFQTDEYEVVESAAYVDLAVVVDFCCPMGQGQIDYYTSDLSATAGQDYKQTSGTVTFVTGTYGRQDIRVPINEDELVEGEEQFEVKLTNFRGSFVSRGHETALVRILDDDPERSSGSSGSPSNQQAGGSRASASSRSPTSASTAPALSGSTDTGNQPGVVNVDDATRQGEPVSLVEAEPPVSRGERNDKRASSLLPAAVGILVLVTIAAVELGLTKRLRRRITANP